MKKIYTLMVLLFFVVINVNAQYTWNNSNGPYGGDIVSVTYDNTEKLYAASYMGMFVSGDGFTWWASGGGLPVREINAVLGDYDGNVFAGPVDKGIYRSQDNGSSWSVVYSGSNLTIDDFILGKSGDVFALSVNETYMAKDNGSSWVTLSKKFTAVNSDADNNIYGGTSSGIFISNDGGNNWNESNTGLDGENSRKILYIFVDADGKIFAGTQGDGVYRSEDKGANWVAVNTGLELYYGLNVNKIAENDNGVIFIRTSQGIYYTLDDGDYWFTMNYEFNGEYVHNIDSFKHTFFACTNVSGLYQTGSNGDAWTVRNVGLTCGNVVDILESANGHIFAALSDIGVFSSDNMGESWNSVTTKRLDEMALSPEGIIYGVSNFDGIFYSTDGGYNWQETASEVSGYPSSIAINEDGTIFVGTSTDYYSSGFWRSIDGGDTWEQLNEGLSYNERRRILCLMVDPMGNILAGSDGAGLYLSTDNGDTWESIPDFASGKILSIAYHDGNYYVGNANGAVYTTDDLVTVWDQIRSGSSSDPNNPDACYDIKVTGDGMIYISTEFGILRTSDNGLNWEKISDWYSEAILVGRDGTVYAGTKGSSVITGSEKGHVSDYLKILSDPQDMQEVDFDDVINYTLTLNDKNGVAVNGVNLKIYNAFTDATTDHTSDAEGKVTYAVTVPDDIANGIYPIRIVAEKDAYEKSIAIFQVKVDHDFPALNLNISPEDIQEVEWIETSPYEITVTDINGSPVQNALVSVKDKYFSHFNDTEIYTDAEGKVTYTAKVPNFLPENTYSISFFASKEKFSNSDTLSRELLIKKPVSVDEEIIDLYEMNVYPNPLANEAVLTFTLRSKTDIVIDLADLSGNSVMRIFNGTLDAGSHRYDLPSAGLANGEYFLRLIDAKNVSVYKVIINK